MEYESTDKIVRLHLDWHNQYNDIECVSYYFSTFLGPNTIQIAFLNITTHIMEIKGHIDGLAQERLNSIANALELCLSCTNSSI